MRSLGDSQGRISIHVFEEYEGLLSEEWLRHVAGCTLALATGSPATRLLGTPAPDSEGPRVDSGVEVVVADDATVRDLNRRHRGLDENTDVLSFSFDRHGQYYGEERPPQERHDGTDFVLPPGNLPGLGEVIISYPQAVRQAKKSGHSANRELALLLAHGILHLLGYDHESPEEEAAMKAQEASVFAQVLINE